jgi:hypothetical protein
MRANFLCRQAIAASLFAPKVAYGSRPFAPSPSA